MESINKCAWPSVHGGVAIQTYSSIGDHLLAVYMYIQNNATVVLPLFR